METSNIMVYIGRHLEKRSVISPISIQRYILNQSEVGKPVALSEIDNALKLLTIAGFIEVESGDAELSTYKRFIPPCKQPAQNTANTAKYISKKQQG
jgi:hypothetical protein